MGNKVKVERFFVQEGAYIDRETGRPTNPLAMLNSLARTRIEPEAADRGVREALVKLDATLVLEAIGRGKSKYAQGRRDLASLLLPICQSLRSEQEGGR
jgi:hypothetical protein